MAVQELTSHQIASQISAARDVVTSLEHDAADLAYPAVAGEEGAAKKLSDMQSQIRKVQADLKMLELAKNVAIAKEVEADAAKDQAYRDRHLQIARDRAAEIVNLAGRADAIVADLRAIHTEIGATEQAIWSALREAGAPPEGSIVGRKNLADFAIAALSAFTNGTDSYRKPRAVADVAAVAWAFLIADEI